MLRVYSWNDDGEFYGINYKKHNACAATGSFSWRFFSMRVVIRLAGA